MAIIIVELLGTQVIICDVEVMIIGIRQGSYLPVQDFVEESRVRRHVCALITPAQGWSWALVAVERDSRPCVTFGVKNRRDWDNTRTVAFGRCSWAGHDRPYFVGRIVYFAASRRMRFSVAAWLDVIFEEAEFHRYHHEQYREIPSACPGSRRKDLMGTRD